jgi:hypothetical protein
MKQPNALLPAVKRVLRIAVRASLVALLGLGLLLVSLLLDHNRETVFPRTTGPFAIGRTAYVWSDPAKTDPFALKPGTRRELVAWIWYPAAPRQTSQSLEDYLPPPVRAATERQWGVTRFLTRNLSRIRVNSIRGAVVSSHQISWPVVLMPGGLTFTILAEDLASHGYVVVSFDVPYRSSLVVFPDGRIVERAPQNDPDLYSGPELETVAARLAQAGSADMSFVLDQLKQLNASDPTGKFVGRLDLQRVGAFGHSIRGAEALQFCHDDPRCKACIDLDGIPWGSAARQGITQPLMILLSDHSGESDEETRQALANLGSLSSGMPRDRWTEIMIRGADHYLFSDDAVSRSPLLMGGLRMLRLVKIDGRRQVALTEHLIATFFDVYLDGAPASELKARAQYPEIEFVH